ncbi:SDR family NAD(P)-dependent oxidoreductase [Ornithinibacillus salinisoli]|uniref:SDR family NAD(P)-dependent oxidoreductase n=1 Tax=Ornithinibacillus salinisoli TaxID=1848459 RepID=A0ABW4W362_9BACI
MYKYSFLESCLFLPTYLNEKKLQNSLQGKTVLITGATSGIGEQLAYNLAEVNCYVILVGRREEKLLTMKQDMEKHAALVGTYRADLRNKEEIEGLLEFLKNLPNGLDFIVSNAGHSIKRSINDSLDRYHDFTRTMAINYFAPVQLLLSVIPLLKKSKGQIINVSTINTLLSPMSHFAAYQASKTACDVWLRSVAPELKEAGITTTTIYLPLVKTPMIQPTTAYRNMPAMSTDHVAKIICKYMYKRKKKYQPWWLLFGRILSIFLNDIPFYSVAKRSKK